MKFSFKLLAQYLIFFGLAFYLLWFATKDLDMDSIAESAKKSSKVALILIAVVGAISVAIRAMRWQLLIQPLGKKPGFLNTFFSIFISYGVNFVTPRLGEVARCGVLSKYEGLPVDKLAGTMIAERIFDLICLVLVAVLTVIFEYMQIKGYMMDTIFMPLQNKYGSSFVWWLLGLLLIGIICAIITWRYLSKYRAKGAQNKILNILGNLQEGVAAVFRMESSVAFLIQTALIWFCYWAMAYIGFKALPELSHLGVGAGLSVLTLGSIGIIATPGGTGAYQLIVGGLLASVYAIDKNTAGAYGIISWALQNGILIVGAVVALIVFPIINRKAT